MTEIDRLKDLLHKNAYPISVIESTVNKFLQRIFRSSNVPDRDTEFPISSTLPLQFRGLHTLLLAKHVRRLAPEIRVVFTTVKSKEVICNLPKIESPIVSKSNVVYQFKCSGCHAHYIGRTKRLLFCRIKEHSRSVLFSHFKNCSNNTSVKHFTECFSIVDWARFYYDLCILEHLYILAYKPSLNSQLCSDPYAVEFPLTIRLFQ